MGDVFDLDYETKSRADLRKVGAYRYASDPSTRIFMFAISKNDGPVLLWLNPVFGVACPTNAGAMALLKEAFTKPSANIYAHNAEFERAISKYRALPDLGVPEPDIRQWRCTAAMARKAGLPASLGAVSEALNLGQKKWGEGSVLIRFFSIPQKETGEFNAPADYPDKFLRFGEYCVQDVRSETEVKHRLKAFELRQSSLDAFLFDAAMNYRGLPVNVKALQHAQKIITETQDRVTKEFRELTGLEPTQRDKVKALLELQYGVKMVNMRAKTLDDTISEYHAAEDDEDEDELVPETLPDDKVALKILELYKQVSFTAVKKVRTMLDCVCDDGMVRGTLMYYGAATGRWSGRLIQPQNFKRPTIKDAHLVYQLICEGKSADEIAMIFGNPLEAIANCIRNFIHDPEGPMFDADYSAIEARIVCWLACQEDALQDYRNGVDRYCKMAANIYGKPISSIKNPSDERELGKRCELGCGYQMGWKKFKQTCWEQYRIKVSDELAQRAVETYRTLNDKVVDLWDNVGEAARNAINRPGTAFSAGKLSFVVKRLAGNIPFLIMVLPSGRCIVYPYPRIERLEGDDREGITFWGALKGKRWGRVRTYGGKLVENATQGTAADVMAYGGCQAEDAGYLPWTLIHDQELAKVLPGQTVEEFTRLLTTLPAWAAGLPIKAEGKIVPFYKK